MVWYGRVWYGRVWYGRVWYGRVWYGRVAVVGYTVCSHVCRMEGGMVGCSNPGMGHPRQEGLSNRPS